MSKKWKFQCTWKRSSKKYSITVVVSLCHLLKNACENNILSEQTEQRSCNEIVQHPTEPHFCLQGENNRFYCTWCCQSVFDLPTQITKYSTLKSHFNFFFFHKLENIVTSWKPSAFLAMHCLMPSDIAPEPSCHSSLPLLCPLLADSFPKLCLSFVSVCAKVWP